MSKAQQIRHALLADQLLVGVMSALEAHYGVRRIALPAGVRSGALAAHLDEHHMVLEFSCYSEFVLIPRFRDGEQLGWWALAHGTNCETRLSCRFRSEIAAVTIPGDCRTTADMQSAAAAALRIGSDFHYSLVAAFVDGSIAAWNRGRFSSSVADALRDSLQSLVVREAVFTEPEDPADPQQAPILESPVLYHVAAIPLIFEAIRRALIVQA